MPTRAFFRGTRVYDKQSYSMLTDLGVIVQLDINPLSGALGAEIGGLDLSVPFDPEILAAVQRAFDEHHVLVFRDQQLTPGQHNDFASQFFELDEHPYVQSIADYPGIIEIVKERDEVKQWGGYHYHMDLSFRDAPPAGAALYAREIPPAGGDTLFANLQLAYDTLSTGMKSLLDTLDSEHESLAPTAYHSDYKGMYAKEGNVGRSVHPLVITHPKTGRRILYVNPSLQRRFSNMTDAESRPLLDYLQKHATRPEFGCRVRWRVGTLVMWNNLTVLHAALNDDFAALRGSEGYRRVLHRATFVGAVPGRA